MRLDAIRLKDYPALLLATTLGSGFFPIAPGTVGSFLAVLVLSLLPELTAADLLAVILVAYFLGVWAAGRCESLWGKDPGRVNWDEVVGQWIAVWFMPRTPLLLLAGFLLFRFFDIFKPSPVRDAENLAGGWGVMTDDVAAGIYANLVLQIGRTLYTSLF